MIIANIFEEVLRMSFYGTIAGLGVWGIGLLVDHVRAPRWIVLCLWGFVGVRLVCPLTINSEFSILEVKEVASYVEDTFDFDGTYAGDFQVAVEGTKQYEKAVEAGSPVKRMEQGTQLAYYYYDETNDTYAPAKTAHEVSSPKYAVVWLCGIGLLWLWAAVDYIRLRMKLRFAMKVSERVYESDEIPSPCVVGIVRPKIYITPNLPEVQKEHILMHEQMHIRYKDPLWKVLSFAVMSVHWFNPFLWHMYKVFQGEIEKACDERVVRTLGEEKKADYSESLLAMARERTWKMPTPISFGEDDTKDRIKTILRYKKPLLAVTVGVVILGILACVVLMTGSTQGDEDVMISTEHATENDRTEIVTEGIGTNESEMEDVSDSIDIDRVFEELNVNGVIYQAKRDGIHRIIDGADELIYDKYPGASPGMMVYDNILYFLTDSYYQEGALEWSNTEVRRIDLESGTISNLELSYSGNGTPIINKYSFFNGVLLVEYQTGSDVYTDVFFLDRDSMAAGEKITMLSAEDAQYFGERMTQVVLSNTGQLTDITGYVKNESTTYLDMDGDGTSEKIFLKILAQGFEYMAREYRLQIGDAYIENYGEELEARLWALSLEGEQILLAIYQDGPSADPYTTFFQYRDGNVKIAGAFEADIRECELHDGVITGIVRRDITQTDWIRVSWAQNEEGILEMIPQETYDFISLNEVDLLETLPVHEGIGSEEIFEVEPQKVVFLQVSADWEWILIKTADGQQGWVHVQDFEVVELRKNVMDVFAGMYLAG